jgi:hypothetical protein
MEMADDGILSETALLTMEGWVQSKASLYGIYGGKVAWLQIVSEYYSCPP